MAMMNVEIISKEIIRPSSPTPRGLRNHKLSFLDQIVPDIHIPLILFYRAKNGLEDVDHLQRSSRLKKSLQQILNRFYPLAGTVIEENTVECNDEGVEFYEARVACNLSQVLQQFNAENFNKFLPSRRIEALVAVQYNAFDCGGVAIGVCVSHRIADAASAATFINAWSATSLGDVEPISPKFDTATYFPWKDMSDCDLTMPKCNTLTRRLVFDKSSIAALRENDVFSSAAKLPTRVEAVSALIWRRLMAISKSEPLPARVCVAVHAVNLRERMVPPMPPHSFGNVCYLTCAVLSSDEVGHDSVLARKLNSAIKEIDGDYVKQLQSDEQPESLKMAAEQFSKGDMEICMFTSWCRFPFYKADFGWGQPTWVCCPNMPFKNFVVLMSSRDEDGIEAFVNILEEDAVVFDSDKELLSFVSGTIDGY
jgi:shikimate O-hydroxycinnamoyltransferase